MYYFFMIKIRLKVKRGSWAENDRCRRHKLKSKLALNVKKNA